MEFQKLNLYVFVMLVETGRIQSGKSLILGVPTPETCEL